LLFVSKSSLLPGMRTETEAALKPDLVNALRRDSEQMPPNLKRMPPHGPHKLRQRRILWICVLGWTAFVGFAIWWLVEGNGGLSVWVFQERDLNEPGFSDRVQALFRGELGLQRTYPWILFGPFLALMGWYFPLERERLLRNLPLNAAACLAFIWGCQAINLRTTETRPKFVMLNPDYSPAPGTPPSGTNGFVAPRAMRSGGRYPVNDGPIEFPGPHGDFKRRPPLPPSRKVSLRSTILDLLAYGAITGLVHSVNFYGRLRERERRALFLESNLAKARLNTLKAQLQPHFLFNSLNAITALLRRDPSLAETTLVSLSELLRLALSRSERQELALREELEFVQRYLEIQQTRFGDKLQVEQNIEPQALDCLVPTLVLQPLVENAIRHGIEPADKPGTVRVSASRKDAKLVLVVEDDGVGLASNGFAVASERISESMSERKTESVSESSTRTGIGLANLRERLRALYGTKQKLELTPRANGGVIVRVEIPVRVLSQ
jgi:anti-sigma regulatory factor (Ser/Thr protein kinase)